MRITVIGTGYVGLVSGACFSDFGHVVTCVDKDAAKIAQLRDGSVPIFEPGLAALVASNVEAGRLSFATESAAAVRAADAIFLAVGTPSRRGDGFADLSFVHDAAREIAPDLQGFTVIVVKSTVPVGTNDEVDGIIRKLRPDGDFAVVSNPEFLREGAAIEDFKRPDRVVVGTDDERARRVMREVYRPLFINETPILFTGRRAAELIKYASNAFLATKIPSSTRWPTCARSAGPTCRRSRAAWGSTAASPASSCMPGRASAARASPRIPRRSRPSGNATARRSGSSKR